MLLPVPRSRYAWKMTIRTAAHPRVAAGSTTPAGTFPRRARPPALPPQDALGQGDHPRRRPRQGLCRPGHRRGIRSRGQGPATGALAQQPALVGSEPAPVRMLARAADAEGRERLRPLRPAAAGDGLGRVAMRGPLAAVLAAVLVALTGCGNGDDENASQTAPTATIDATARPPAASTLPSGGSETRTQTQTSPYSTAPQAPGEGNGGASAPPSNGGTPAP